MHLFQGLSPGSDCFTALQRDKRQIERIQRINEEDKARRIANRAAKEKDKGSP
jgi:hypothetical protein